MTAKDMEKPTICLILVTGVIGPRHWLYGSGDKDKRENQPLGFLSKAFPGIRVEIFNTIDAVDYSDGQKIVQYPDLGQRGRDLLLHIDAVKRQHANSRDNAHESSPKLIFAGHDIGGITVKQALVTANYEAQYEWVVKSTIAALLFETPHCASNQYAWEKSILQMLALSEVDLDFVSYLDTLPGYASRLEGEFQGFLKGCYSANFHAQKSPLHSAVEDPKLLNIGYDKSQFLSCDAREMWSIGEDEPAAEQIRQFLSNYITDYCKNYSRGDINIPRLLGELDHEWHLLRSSNNWPLWYSFNDQIWKTQWYDDWAKESDNGVLHVVGPSGSGVTSFASRTLHQLRGHGEIVLAYSMLSITAWPQHDSEIPIIRLFHSFCQQLLQTFSGSPIRLPLCPWLIQERLFTKEALIGLLCSLLSSHAGSSVFCIIHGIHILTTELLERLFKDLETILKSSKVTLKVLITSITEDVSYNLPQSYITVKILEEQQKHGILRLLATAGIESLAGSRPALRQQEQKESAINKLCDGSRTIFELSRKLDWIRSVKSPHTIPDVESTISGIPMSIEETMDDIFQAGNSVASSALKWILFSPRALSVPEISVCVAMEAVSKKREDLETLGSKISWNTSGDLWHALGHIVHISGDRVRIPHRYLTPILRSRTVLSISNEPHLSLLSECVQYLKVMGKRWENITANPSNNQMPKELLLMEYAAIYWPYHGFLAHPSDEATTLIFDFLQNPDHLNTWLNILNNYRHHLSPGNTELEQPKSPVEVACHFGLIGVVNKFLQQPLTEPSIQGLMSGLDLAIEKGYTDIAERIIAKGAISETASIRAARFGRTKVLKALINSISENTNSDDSGTSPLLEAIYGGHLETATLLLDHGADADVKNGKGHTPLHLASRIGQQEIVEKLITLGISLTSQDEDGYTALMYASEGGFDSIVQSIISAFIEKKRHSESETMQTHMNQSPITELDVYNSTGDTALHLAVYSSHRTTVKLLLELGASPEKRNKIGNTPLHLASIYGFSEITKMLLERLPETTCESDIADGRQANAVVAGSPLKLAVHNRHLPVIKELLLRQEHKMEASSLKAVSYACECGHSELILDMLKWHRDLPLTDGPLQSDDGTTALHLAVDFGHLKLVEDILVHKLVPIDLADKDGWTSLHKASKRGDVDIIKILLGRNAILKDTTKDGYTALHIAAKYGHAEACATLAAKDLALTMSMSRDDSLPVVLAAKEDHFNVVKELLRLNKETPKDGLLHIAVQNNSENLLKILLELDINVDWIGKDGNSAVHEAVSSGKVSIVQRLYKAGANMSTKDQSGRTPLFIAVEANNLDMVKALMKLDCNVAPDEKDNRGFTPLLEACSRFLLYPKIVIEIVRELLEHSSTIDVNAQHPFSGKTPLHYSTDGKEEGLTTLLLDKGADPNISNKRGSTPIFLAAEVGKVETIRALVDKGAKTSIRNNSSTTPLHRAAGNHHAECISLLLSRGAEADINVKNLWGRTPLALAVINRSEDCIKALLEYHPDLTIVDDDGLTPLEKAIDDDDDDIAEILIDSMKLEDIHQTIRGATLSGHTDVVSTLLRNSKANGPNISDTSYGSLLGLAIARRETSIASILIEWPAIEVDTRDSVGRTPLLIATCVNNITMVEALTKLDADPNARDDDGDWPLIRAIMQNHKEIVKILVSFNKTDLSQKDGRGHDALYWACRQRHQDIFTTIHNAIESLPDYRNMCELALHAAVASKYDSAIETLLMVEGLDLNKADEDGWTPLYTAECYEHADVKQKLLKAGADPDLNVTLKTPSIWHDGDKCAGLSVSKITPAMVSVEATTKKPTDMDGNARYVTAKSDHALPGNKNWYFEVKIQQAFREGEQSLGVGIAEDNAVRFLMLGVENPNSFGYHADDGDCYPSQAANEMDSGETYGQGDIIGCGYVYKSRLVYFKRNGENLGQAFADIKGKFYAAVFMSSREVGVSMSATFNKVVEKKKTYREPATLYK